MGKHIFLSKSKIKDNSRCSMMLWHELNQPHLKEWDQSNVSRFEQGREVEALARSFFPNAIEQDKKSNLEKVEYTKELLAKPYSSIYEAAFLYNNVIIQFDVLNKNEVGTFDAVEVKSSSKFKEDYELDVIIQYWVAKRSGIEIRNFQLWYVNTQDDNGYFGKKDLKEFVEANEERFEQELAKAQKTYHSKEMPEFKVGAHCDSFECPFRNTPQCKVSIEKNSVLALPNFRKKWNAHNEGITTVEHKDFEKFEYKNELVIESIKANALIIQPEALDVIRGWSYPLNFMDFEAVMGAMPLLENTKPYEQVVIQFSNHIYNKDNKMTHQMFLHDNKSNPDLAVIEHLLKFLDNNGSIVSYNKVYEQTRIRNLAKKHKMFSKELLSLVERFVDLMDVIKDHVYHPEFYGSYSLKVVSPVLLKEYGSYSDSVIKSGGEINKYFKEFIETPCAERKEELRKALFKYCQYDTLNLFLIKKFLMNQNENIGELVKLNMEENNLVLV
jgi:predicted RecB family nuclease